MKRILHGTLGAFALALSAASPALAADPVSECQEKVLADCADAMDGARWYERFALGVVCAGRLAGCSTINIIIGPK